MPVFTDSLWWYINWPWMVAWLATAVSVMVLVARHRRRRPAERLVFEQTCVYLDDQAIMDVYWTNQYAPAVQKEVEQRTAVRKKFRFLSKLPLFSPGVDVEDNREVITKYIQRAEPISVIGVIVNALERSHAIIHSDLLQGTVRRNPALAKAGFANGSVRLSATSSQFLLLTGDFEKDDNASSLDYTVLGAAYGPTSNARIRISCRTTGLRSAEGAFGRFRVLCLGKVVNWHPEDAILDVHPLAIFS